MSTPPPTAVLRPNAGRARAAMTLLLAILLLNLLSLGSGMLQYQLLDGIADGEVFPEEVLERNDLREQVIGIVFLVTYVICGVLFIRWFRRAYFNLHSLTTGLREGEGWAAGAWFIPIVNLYKPFQLMKELFVRTIELLERSGTPHKRPDTSVLNIWWALWIASGLVGQTSFRMAMNADDLDAITDSTLVGMAANLVDIPLCLLALWLVRTYAAMERHLPGLPGEIDRIFPAAPVGTA